jgi:hypothetical protein
VHPLGHCFQHYHIHCKTMEDHRSMVEQSLLAPQQRIEVAIITFQSFQVSLSWTNTKTRHFHCCSLYIESTKCYCPLKTTNHCLILKFDFIIQIGWNIYFPDERLFPEVKYILLACICFYIDQLSLQYTRIVHSEISQIKIKNLQWTLYMY